MEIKKIKLQIGEFDVIAIPTGEFGLDGGAMFGTVPKVLWEKSNPADEKNRIPMEARALLLKSEKYKILIDCGNGSDFVAKYGEKLGNKFAEMYKIDPNGASLMGSLKKHGVEASDITHVILTHLHFDHCAGGVSEINGKLQATFPKAQYFVQSSNYETAIKPNLRERASYFANNFQPLLEAKKLTLQKDEVSASLSTNAKADFAEIGLPGISVAISNGHTQGHQVVKITDGTNTLLYCGDTIPTSSHVRIPWLMGYDLNPVLLMEEKTKLLGPAAEQGWYLYFEHDPYCDMAKITANGADFQVVERYQLW